jgi:hypothetical protein
MAFCYILFSQKLGKLYIGEQDVILNKKNRLSLKKTTDSIKSVRFTLLTQLV